MVTKARIIACLSLIFFVFAIASGSALANETIVYPGQSIQRVLNDATEGDVITVMPGSYNQYIEINKDNLTLRSASGPEKTFIYGTKRLSDVMQVIANNTTVSGFTVTIDEDTKNYFNNNGTDVHGICLNSKINNCSILGNNVTNTDFGINLDNARDCTVKYNVVENNKIGIRLFKAYDNLLTLNLVNWNEYGVWMQTSDGNQIYNNSFNNTVNNGINAWVNMENTWNASVGNYWSDYEGVDEEPEDGIGDTPYKINNKNSDHRPLMELVIERPEAPITPEPPVTPEPPAPSQPTANFDADRKEGPAPLMVNFTDLSENVTGWHWDFGDENESNLQNPTHIYAVPGNYTVNLTVFNGTLSDSEEDYIIVTAESSGGDDPDTKPPVTYDDVPVEWQSSNFTVTFTVEDTDWNATFYQVDGGEWKIGNSVEITEDGNHSITYYSDDLEGNAELPKTAYAKLDTSAPVTTDDAPDGWQNSSFTVTLDSVDLALNTTFYRVDGGEWKTGNSIAITEDGDHIIAYYSDDLAGNTESPKVTYAKLDTVAPVTTDNAPAECQNLNFSVMLTVQDFNWNVTFYQVDGGEWKIGNSVEITENGNHSITYYSDDLAGNVEVPKTVYVKLDKGSASPEPVSKSHRSGGDGVGSAKIIRKEKLELIEESEFAAGSSSPGENPEKSDEYKALNVQKNMANSVEASGSEQEEKGSNIPWTVLPGALIGLACVAYLMSRGKKG